MIRISKQEVELLKEKSLGRFIRPTSGHHKNWYAVENYRVLTALGKVPADEK